MNDSTPRADDYLVPWMLQTLGNLAPPARVVDIGCGDGFAAAAIAAQGHAVKGFDISEKDIALARAAYPDLDLQVSSIYDPGLAKRLGPADCVVALEVVEHLFQPRALFELAYALLPDGGRLLLTTPHHGYLKNLALSLLDGWDKHFTVEWDGGHIKFFSRRTLEKMARAAGFKKCRFGGIGRVPYLWKSAALVAQK